MVLTPTMIESEISKLRGLLQILHDDQPDVMEDVFRFHVNNLIGHAPEDQHPRIRSCAAEMLEAIRAQPRAGVIHGAQFQLMPELELARTA